VQTRARSETALAQVPLLGFTPYKRRAVRPARIQDREVKCGSQEPRLSGKGQAQLKFRRGSLVQEEGGQGVLMRRKRQGLCAYQVHRPGDRALAIVSKTSRPIS